MFLRTNWLVVLVGLPVHNWRVLLISFGDYTSRFDRCRYDDDLR